MKVYVLWSSDVKTSNIYNIYESETKATTESLRLKEMFPDRHYMIEEKELVRDEEDRFDLESQNLKFKTGDFARIVANKTEHGFKIGDIVKLEKYDTDYQAYCEATDEYWWVVDDDLEVL